MEYAPLAERLRPKTIDEFIGQEHITVIFRQAIASGLVPSIILWGPPGVGKTTLAGILANGLKRPFYSLSAINSGVKEIRDIISRVEQGGLFGTGNAILFIDEIHRFSKSQQDSLLGAVEKGVLTLIGATTENPSFEVNSALLSRCQVYVLKALEVNHLESLISRALNDDPIISRKGITIDENKALMRLSGGDARRLLNVFETVVNALPANETAINDELVNRIIQQNPAMYDKDGEQHYDIISAFIKSVRGSDPNGAVYWMARMLEGGEDPKFIARRLIILSSEDIGNANPTGLIMANAAFDAVQKIGMPEARIVLSQCAVYLASSPKSNASYEAINAAMEAARIYGDLPVPIHLRNAPTKLMKDLGYGKDYQYSHAYAQNFSEQEYLPEKLSGTKYYEPGANSREDEMRRKLRELWGVKYGY